ncbi:MAG: 2Fe-2S iron-sulfur cluster-binding protein [Flavobacteriaceae bacterium]|jgi:2Fe-2S ferredoxin|tara:strand:+ start:190 stop:516 length:327 start_codon:yes stop_codon:yes gene_type:complete
MDNQIKILVKDRDGKSHDLITPTDMSLNLMEVLKINEFDIEGTCGGIAMCASCQCYIKSNHKLDKKSFDEEAMLSEAFYVKKESRLGCQIKITKDLNDLKVEIAPKEN